MPDLSSTSPISVKNGTASRDSLEILPKSRCGKACSKAGCIRPRLMATTPYKMPVRASETATGNPKSKNTNTLANMIGARLLTKKSMTRSDEHTSELKTLMRNSYHHLALQNNNTN